MSGDLLVVTGGLGGAFDTASGGGGIYSHSRAWRLASGWRSVTLFMPPWT